MFCVNEEKVSIYNIQCYLYTTYKDGHHITFDSPSDFSRQGTIMLYDFGIVPCEILPEFDSFTRVIPILQGMTKSVITCSQQQLFVSQCMSEIEQSKWHTKVRNGKVCQGWQSYPNSQWWSSQRRLWKSLFCSCCLVEHVSALECWQLCFFRTYILIYLLTLSRGLPIETTPINQYDMVLCLLTSITTEKQQIY